jgi:hypothetical protein
MFDETIDYPLLLGPAVYDLDGITGLNRSPVDMLADFAGTGVRFDGSAPPRALKPRALVKRRLTNGSVIVLNPTMPEAKYWVNTHAPDDMTIHEYFNENIIGSSNIKLMSKPDDSLEEVYSPVMRIWTKGATEWQGVTYRYQSWQLTEDTSAAALTLPLDSVYVYPGGRGALYYAQKIWRIIEQHATDAATAMTGKNLLPVFSGNIGNAQKVATAIRMAIKAIIIPGNVQRDQMTSSNIVSQLRELSEQRKQEYFAALRVVEQDSPNRPVANDRAMRLKPQTDHAEELQESLAEIYAALGYSPVFEPLIVATAAERTEEKLLLDSIRTMIGEDEYQRRIKRL